MPITQIGNLSIKFSNFLKDCKVAKLNPLYKKGTKAYPSFPSSDSLQNYRKSNTRRKHELFNGKYCSLQIPVWVPQEPLKRYFSRILDR